MIYITGDCHNNFTRFQKNKLKDLPFTIGEGDYVIACGDFGLLWEMGKTADFNRKNLFDHKKFTTLWVPGNHDNYEVIRTYPVSEWNGGRVRKITDNVIMLERGQIFTIEGSTFFTMGGASTHDAKYFLDPADPEFAVKKKTLNRKECRVLGTEWWPEELPSAEELEEGRRNLAEVAYKVDYVITHCACGRLQKEVFKRNYAFDCLNEYFEELEQKLTYKRWFFGHYHTNCVVDEKHICLYEKIIPLEWSRQEVEEYFRKKVYF